MLNQCNAVLCHVQQLVRTKIPSTSSISSTRDTSHLAKLIFLNILTFAPKVSSGFADHKFFSCQQFCENMGKHKFLNLSYNVKYFGQKDSKPWQVLQSSHMGCLYMANI